MAKHDEMKLLRDKNRQLQRQLAVANQTIRNMKNEDVRALLAAEVQRADQQKERADRKAHAAYMAHADVERLQVDLAGVRKALCLDESPLDAVECAQLAMRTIEKYKTTITDEYAASVRQRAEHDKLKEQLETATSDLLRAEFDRADLLKIVKRYLEPS